MLKSGHELKQVLILKYFVNKWAIYNCHLQMQSQIPRFNVHCLFSDGLITLTLHYALCFSARIIPDDIEIITILTQ